MRFNDLLFSIDPDTQMKRAKVFFSNGFGASIVIGPFSFGGPKGLYELAILRGTSGRFKLSFDNPISSRCSDPIFGHLNEDDIEALLEQIANLPAINPLFVLTPEEDELAAQRHKGPEKTEPRERFLDL